MELTGKTLLQSIKTAENRDKWKLTLQEISRHRDT